MREGDLAGDRVSQHLGRGRDLRAPVLGDIGVKLIEKQLPGDRMLDPREELLDDAKRSRSDTRAHARMHALIEHAHMQRAHEIASQGGRAPQLLVVTALGVQANDERRIAERVAQGVKVRRKVHAATLFRRLNDQYAARERDALCAQRRNGREGAEYRIAVIGASAAIELAIAHHRLPGTQSRQPAGEFGLLVQMSVEQCAPGELAANVNEQQGRLSGQAPDLHLHALDRLRATPIGHQLHGGFHVAVRLPIGIEQGRLVRDANVRGEPLEDRVVPDRAHEPGQRLQIHRTINACSINLLRRIIRVH